MITKLKIFEMNHISEFDFNSLDDIKYFVEKENGDINNFNTPLIIYFINKFSLKDDEEEIYKITKYLLKNGANINAQTNLHTPLICTLINGFHKVSNFLIDNGADPNTKPLGNGTDTPLLKALVINKLHKTKIDHTIIKLIRKGSKLHHNEVKLLTPTLLKYIKHIFRKQWNKYEKENTLDNFNI